MLDKTKEYWFIGIKGTGMASLALILHDMGYHVAGSDIEKHTFTQDPLLAKGIKITPFDANNIKDQGQVIIKGNAFKEENVEVKACIDKKIAWQSYPDTVQEIIAQHTSIGVSGSHGKTSTTGLLAHVLGQLAPTSFLIGDGTGKAIKDSRFFVYEADEYRRHFLAYHPDYQIMTNVDFDHPDYFKDRDDYASAFQTAAEQTKKGLFVWGDDTRLNNIQVSIPKYTYGFNNTDDFQAYDIQKNITGSTCKVKYHDIELGQFEIHLFGDHNILNTTAVIAVAYIEKESLDLVRAALLTYKGAKRRFSEKSYGKINIIDDYAHHPTEMKATLQAARQKYPNKILVAIFQPHTYSRTAEFADQFVEILKTADYAYVTPIFGSARENQGNISSQDLTKRIPNSEVISLDNIADLTKFKDAVLVFMGAGDITKYEVAYEALLEQNK